jgi:3-phosphoshikimate 1-carboxyvinyltransferase
MRTLYVELQSSAVDRLVVPSDFTGARFTAPVPSGKSEILRAVAAVALGGKGVVRATPPFGQDVTDFITALGALGAEIVPASDRIVVMRPVDRERTEPAAVHVGEGGAPARFLLALAATLRGAVTLTGGTRLSARPFAALARALADLGARVIGGPGLPITVRGPLIGGFLRAELSSETSQFVSALLLVAPAMERPLELELTGVVRSAPYIDLTVAMMRRAGARIAREKNVFRVEPGFDPSRTDLVAPIDWSGAVPLLAATAFIGRPTFVPGLDVASPHPDAAFAGIAERIGLTLRARDGGVEASGSPRRGGSFDLGGAPDLAPVLAVLGAVAPGGIAVRNAPQLRVKESDRIADLVAMLDAAGIPAAARDDGFLVPGCWAEFRPRAEIAIPLDPRGDHRLAMAAALIGLVRPVVIHEAGVVAKSFPTFFDVFPAEGRWRTEDVDLGSGRLI